MILRIIGRCIRLSQIAHAYLPFPFPMICLWYFLRLGQTLRWHFHKDVFVWLWLQCAMYGSRYLEWNTNLERPPVQMRGRRIFIVSYAIQIPSRPVVPFLMSSRSQAVLSSSTRCDFLWLVWYSDHRDHVDSLQSAEARFFCPSLSHATIIFWRKSGLASSL